MAEFASKGVAGAALGTGIAGLTLGVGNLMRGNGLLGGLFGGGCYNGGCSENQLVNRYELQQEQKIANLESQIALRDANTFTDSKIIELYKYVDGELKDIRATQNDKWTEQAVINCKQSSGLSVLGSQVQDITNVVNSITKTAVPSSAICDFGCGCGCNGSATLV